jgi:hypothetical protein
MPVYDSLTTMASIARRNPITIIHSPYRIPTFVNIMFWNGWVHMGV